MNELMIEIKDNIYNLIIVRKPTTKNMYLRIKANLDIYVTCNTLFSDKSVLNFIKKNEDGILKMIEKTRKKEEKKESFYYLGKKYDLVYLNQKGIMFGDEKVFVDEDFDLDKWYRKKAEVIFYEELERKYKEFVYQIPHPSLLIRKMKTRWGVCNVKTHRITLNLELIKKDKRCLEYVIVHELSHLLHPNHSRDFWKCVEDNYKDYKKVRKELKNE